MEKIIALKEEITGLRKQAIELRDDKNVSYSNIALYIERLTANMLLKRNRYSTGSISRYLNIDYENLENERQLLTIRDWYRRFVGYLQGIEKDWNIKKHINLPSKEEMEAAAFLFNTRWKVYSSFDYGEGRVIFMSFLKIGNSIDSLRLESMHDSYDGNFQLEDSNRYIRISLQNTRQQRKVHLFGYVGIGKLPELFMTMFVNLSRTMEVVAGVGVFVRCLDDEPDFSPKVVYFDQAESENIPKPIIELLSDDSYMKFNSGITSVDELTDKMVKLKKNRLKKSN